MKRSTLSRVGATCAGAIVAAGLAAAPALAAPSPAQKGSRATAAPVARPATNVTTPQTPYLGGYYLAPSDGAASVSSTFTIPKTATCATNHDYEDVFIGEELLPPTGNFYEGGETDAASDVFMECPGNGGLLDYLEAYTFHGADAYELVQPGDKIQTRIVQSPNGTTYVTTTDLTHYSQETSSGTTVGDDNNFFAGVIPNITYESYGTPDYYIPKFGTIKFSDSQVNALDFNAATPQALPYALNQTGKVQVMPGKLGPASKPSPNWSVTEKSPL